jgi:hyperosmotically inducible periplasmic protein
MRPRWTHYLAIGFVLVMTACGQSDAGITTAVKTGLATDDVVKPFQVDVDTKDKVVTLSGTVDSPAAKDRAVTVAQGTKGVVSVIDKLSVRSTSTPGRPAEVVVTDAALTAAVKTKLLADTRVGGLKIDVDSRNGVVTLSGTVRSQAEKDEALRLARETESVRNVEDKLTIAP